MTAGSSAPGSLNEAQPGVRRAAPQVAPARPRSWPSSACTSCTCLEGAHPRTSSHATGGRGCGTESGPPSAYCGGTFCTDARPPTPSLWWFGQNHLKMLLDTQSKVKKWRKKKITWNILELYLLLSGDANNMWLLVTYVDEIRSVLTCHPKAKVSPESRLLPYYLHVTTEQAGNVLMTFVLIHSGPILFIIFALPAFVEGEVGECGWNK